MTGGYAGKILRVNLTSGQIGSIPTSKYEEFGGGYGIGAAIFWELCVAPGTWDLQDAFDPRNVITLMSGPLAATGIFSAGRTSVSGLAPQSWPVNWFSHSNFGGSFSPSLKLAGWDGIVIEGRSAVDESMLTGESVAATKTAVAYVIGSRLLRIGAPTTPASAANTVPSTVAVRNVEPSLTPRSDASSARSTTAPPWLRSSRIVTLVMVVM